MCDGWHGVSKISDLKCKCGGHAKYLGSFMIDQLVCTKCNYKTHTYFDGLEYAISQWEKDQTSKENQETSIPHQKKR